MPLELVDVPSPNHDARAEGPVDILVMHYTGMLTAEEALARLCDPDAKVSAHYTVDRDGLLTSFSFGLVGAQALASLVTIGYAFGVSLVILKVVDLTVGLRVAAEDEVAGLDASQHGERGYVLGTAPTVAVSEEERVLAEVGAGLGEGADGVRRAPAAGAAIEVEE